MVRTLVIHTGGIGDLLLTCPVLSLLAHEGPVDMLGRPSRLLLTVEGGIAEAAYDIAHVEFESVFTTPTDRFRQFAPRYDRCIVWMRDDDGVIQHALRECGIADVRAFPGLPPETWSEHASRYYLACLEFSAVSAFRLNIAPVPPLQEVDVVIHPGSGGRRKNWPLEWYENVSARLLADGYRVAWILGPAEVELCVPDQVPCIRCESLVDLAAQLAACTLYLGNDSGITHLAASVGCPVIALFGPTNSRVWAPLGEHVTILCGDVASQTTWPTVDAVMQSLYDHLLPVDGTR